MTPRQIRAGWLRLMRPGVLARDTAPANGATRRMPPRPDPSWLEPAVWRQRRSGDRPWRPWP